MNAVPARPCIYHITHVNNLQSIIHDGGLWSDAKILQRGGPPAAIGMSTIKARRARWAFTLSNAGATYAEFCNRPDQLAEIDWAAVSAKDVRNPDVKEGKQAEFLIHEFFPWHLVQRMGVLSTAVQARALHTLAPTPHRPAVEVRPDWYF